MQRKQLANNDIMNKIHQSLGFYQRNWLVYVYFFQNELKIRARALDKILKHSLADHQAEYLVRD